MGGRRAAMHSLVMGEIDMERPRRDPDEDEDRGEEEGEEDETPEPVPPIREIPEPYKRDPDE